MIQPIKTKKKKSHISSEHVLQLECIALFRNEIERHQQGCIIPVLNELAFKRKDVTINAGASDLIVVLPGKVLFVELKVGYNQQQQNQIEFERLILNLHHEYHVIRSLEEFKKLIYGNNPL